MSAGMIAVRRKGRVLTFATITEPDWMTIALYPSFLAPLIWPTLKVSVFQCTLRHFMWPIRNVTIRKNSKVYWVETFRAHIILSKRVILKPIYHFPCLLGQWFQKREAGFRIAGGAIHRHLMCILFLEHLRRCLNRGVLTHPTHLNYFKHKYIPKTLLEYLGDFLRPR